MLWVSCPLWDFDDVTRCGRDQYLDFGYPLLVGGLSLAVLASKTVALALKKPVHLSGETRPLLASSGACGSAETPEVSVKERHFDITRLPDTNDDGTPHGQVHEVYKNGKERLRVAVEFLLVTAQLGLCGALFFDRSLVHEWRKTPWVPVAKSAFWAYAFVLVALRTANLRRVVVRMPSLWVHSTTLYFFHLFPSVLTCRSALIGNVHSAKAAHFYVAEFAIGAVLALLNFTATVADKPSKMYFTSDGVTPSPEGVSSLLSFVTYSWINPKIWAAYKRPLTVKDIWGLRQDDYALHVLKSFEAAGSTTAFGFRLFSHFKWLFAAQAFWAIMDSIIVFFPSLLLKSVLEYVADPTSVPKNVAWAMVVLMPIAKIMDSISSGCSLFLGRRVCVRMRAIIIGEIYAKALRRKITVQKDDEKTDEKKPDDDKEDAEGGKTAELGAIINLMAVDAYKVSEVCGYLHFFVSALLMISICIVLLYGLLGWSAIVGSAAIVALLPLNYKVARWVARLQKENLAVTDKRIQKLNETFQSIRIIKFFAWEDLFFDQIMKIRHEEIYLLKARMAAWCVGSFIWFITPTGITLLSFYCYTVVEGRTLTAPIAFTALSLFTLLRSPLDQLSDMTSFVIQSKVSLDRVDKFLGEEETTKYDQLDSKRSANSPHIGFKNASFSWNAASASDFKLRELNVAFEVGKLNVVIGPTGAGKTSLLLALLGEMDLTEGQVFLPGIIPRDELVVDQSGFTESVAYCAQSAWLLNDTIRNNITFAAPFNQERYDRVVEACGLSRDFEILSAGDATEVGEKGITLSGGQKQRVSLARALYLNLKHLLLDDCLSAVDSHTALWIYENCICGPLMKGRTCILVSHNVALTAQQADWIVVMDNGRVKTQGTPSAMLETGELGDDSLVRSSVMNLRNQSSTSLSLDAKNADLKAKAATIEAKLKAIGDDPDDSKKTDGKLVEEETKAEGVVGFSVYKGYAQTFGGWGTYLALIFLFAISQVFYMLQSWWLRRWSASSEAQISTFVALAGVRSFDGASGPVVRTFTGGVRLLGAAVAGVEAFKEQNSSVYYVVVYGIVGLAYALLASLRVIYTNFAGIAASNRIFKRVLKTVLRARLRFFDKTPQGRIMNRFSKDIELVDQELIPFAEGALICLVACMSVLVLIVFITPGFLVFAVLIAFVYYLVGFFYLTLSRELQRFESISKSPIHQHFSESLNGVATIRAYGVESRFMKQNLQAIDNNSKPFFYLWVANRWLALRIETVGAMVMFAAGVFVLISVGHLDAGLAGLSLSYAIAFSETALWVVRLYSNIEMNMNSVERLQEYFEIEQEPPAEVPETEPVAEWPQEGAISVKDVSLRYSPELPRVIKNVTFEVSPNQKIGIVGRTGAGKSTIITAFFRFLEPETGSIHIDGVDITQIGLKNLRQAITIIPQDPTLFTGDIRSNLDPFDQYTDAQIFEALRRVNLIAPGETATSDANENQNKFLNLDTAISEGGNNLSQGQRQLMCMARSLLKSPKVILLDEATASIDYKLDAMIQQTIRDEFSNSTILTIAHRLRSIVDYDRILVMDAGRVVEYEDPYVLITDKSSLFYLMCENSGELDTLTMVAKEAFVKKKNAGR